MKISSGFNFKVKNKKIKFMNQMKNKLVLWDFINLISNQQDQKYNILTIQKKKYLLPLSLNLQFKDRIKITIHLFQNQRFLIVMKFK